MESLHQQKFILFDVQTTGTNAETSQIIEAGWGLYEASEDPLQVKWNVHLVALKEATDLPRRIQKLTGLSAVHGEDETAMSYAALISELSAFLREHDALPILVHYARFKRPFLLKIMHDAGHDHTESRWSSLSERIVCTYELARRSMPHLKSFSLRAVAGYAGYSLGDKKRSLDHLIATAVIWRHLVETGASTSPPGQTLPLHAADIRQKRLQLPDQPGVYYFQDQAERVLYVGKASNLKHRLNSYFRGQKTKGSRLNEMLTRAVDFRTVVLATELEALLLESDEIKRLDPPYNRLLKTDVRRIQSVRLNDWLLQPEPWGYRRWGPLLSLWNLQWLLAQTGLAMHPEAHPESRWVDAIFTADLLAAGKMQLFGSLEFTELAWRTLMRELWETSRRQVDETDEETIEVEESPAEEPAVVTAEQAADLIKHTLLNSLRQLHRARWLLRLAECTISWPLLGPDKPSQQISISSGVPHIEPSTGELRAPEGFRQTWQQRLALFDVAMYDRLSIIYNELRRAVRRGDPIQICLRPGLDLSQKELMKHLL